MTLRSREDKEKLITEGINIRGTYNNVFDLDKLVTNVTIKDAPYELSDSFVLHHMKPYGDIVEHSLKRGKIKGTDIDTGTRYLQMVHVREVLPNKVNLGRFRVRIFSDNKTECRFCKKVGHPFYQCPEKDNPPPRLCNCCKSPSYISKDCTNDIVCNFRSAAGHVQKKCEEYKISLARRTYGEYADEIFEGKKQKQRLS